MGKTPKPLRILVADPSLGASLAPYAEKGHEVVLDDLMGYDLIVGRQCWRMWPELTRYIDVAVKAAREGKTWKKRKRS